MTRRTFAISAGSALTATSASRVLGANDRIRVGLIGAGNRGRFLMSRMAAIPGVTFVAVSDLYGGALDAGRKIAGDDAMAYKDYRRLLHRKDVDAVVVATQNHWHARASIDAMSAGKDVYVEKPMTHKLDEGPAMIEAAQRYGRVAQVGSQRRSSAIHLKAKEIVQSGQIGKVTFARVQWHRNSGAMEPPYRFRIPADASPETIDWKTYLQPAPSRPFDAKRFFDWYCYWDYCEGIAEDLLVHCMDAAQMVLGLTAPIRVVSDGGVFYWNDGREVPDTINAIFQYAEGVQIEFTSTFANGREGNRATFYGKNGTLDVNFLDSLRLYPETDDGRTQPASLTIAKEQLGVRDSLLPHLENFFDCVRSRAKTNCPVEVGEKGAICSHLATTALREQRVVHWDDARRRIS